MKEEMEVAERLRLGTLPGQGLPPAFEDLFRKEYARVVAIAHRASRTHVDNAAHAVVVAATDDRARGRIYNVGDEDAMAWIDWARLVASHLRWTGEFVVAPSGQMPTRLRDSRPDVWDHHLVSETSRIRRELGYREVVGREDGLARALAWYAASPMADPAGVPDLDYAAEDEALVTIRNSAVL